MKWRTFLHLTLRWSQAALIDESSGGAGGGRISPKRVKSKSTELICCLVTFQADDYPETNTPHFKAAKISYVCVPA